MQNFHSTLSRRDFMKGIGLAGAGFGAAAATAPVFRDLDEGASIAANTYKKNPWWVKERNYCDPTTPIDWMYGKHLTLLIMTTSAGSILKSI
ncbi:MAG: hypothetical protein AMXMBFR85_11660 [Dehalococcoides mccartyi]